MITILFPERMKKVTITVHQKYIEDVIFQLHETGYVQIQTIQKEPQQQPDHKNTADVETILQHCTSYEQRLTHLLEILQKSKQPKKGLRNLLSVQPPQPQPVQPQPIKTLFSQTEKLLKKIEQQIITYDERLQTLQEHYEHITQEQIQLNTIHDIKINLSYLQDSPNVLVRLGKTDHFPIFKADLDSSDLIIYQTKEITKGKKKEWILLLIAHISEQEKIEKIMREHVTMFTIQTQTGTPQQALQQLQQQEKNLQKEKKDIYSTLTELRHQHQTTLLALREQLQLERIRKDITKIFTQTPFTYSITGWMLERNEQSLQTLLATTTKDRIYCSFETPSPNPDNPPTYLRTPGWAKTFKTFIDLFASPKYTELNPTIFIGLFFVLFFGLMLGDAGYGLTLFFISLFGYIKIGKTSQMIKDWSFLGMLLGISTTIFGLLMNSFFGDFIPRFIYNDPTRTLYSLQLMGIQLPLDSLRDPLTMLTIALVCGLVHLNLGIILGLIQTAKQKHIKAFFTQHFCWIPMQIGGGLLIGNFILKWQISFEMTILAAFLTLLGVILLFIHAGPIGFFGITGYIGDWLSYARLLALGLATSGMALAFNVVAELMSAMIPFIGIIILPIILIIAHLANLVIQALGAGVHSLRLQYVEFFNRFYEGGGHEFTPFKVKRTFTKLETNQNGGNT